MMKMQSYNAATGMFIFSTLLLVSIMYHRIEDPMQFYLMGGGLVTFSFFLMRAINQLVR